MLTFSGIILGAKWIQHIGVIKVFISWFTTSVVSWKRKKTGFITSIALIFLGVIGIVTYSYLI
ncbi:hypothetical protein [Paracerasibacillus soli]|uniref:Uncharacterized protein n=1 Tax=Paracerasibacillus soli TaxID=480284 RepID=A0ABU5CNN4_9BACI|nr:hypothetical protein [Virgibacillus soli]MDY0407414.1 hypothetical protein [Virgibacillus soli]